MCLVTQIAARIQILCLIVHTESVHKRTQILCLGIIHLFVENMDWAKGQTTNFFLKGQYFLYSLQYGPIADLVSSHKC
jgi:hypothetical protein